MSKKGMQGGIWGDITKLEGPAFVGSVWLRPRKSPNKLG